MTDQSGDTMEAADAMDAHAKLRALATPAPSLDGAGALPDLVKDRFITVDVEALVPDPDNARTELRNIESLADNILRNGLKQTILVRKKGRRWYLAEGHRRHAALRTLVARGHTEWRYVPAMVEDPKRSGDLDALETMLSANRQRVDLDPIEEGRLIRKWMHGRKIGSYEEAAELLGGVSHHTLRSRCQLIDHLTTAEQQEVRGGTLTLTAALDRVKLRREQDRRDAAAGVVRGGRRRTDAGAKRSKAAAASESANRLFYFGPAHRLQSQARLFCHRDAHRPSMRLAGVACGECWEAVIVEDTRRTLLAELEQQGGKAAARAHVQHRVNQFLDQVNGSS